MLIQDNRRFNWWRIRPIIVTDVIYAVGPHIADWQYKNYYNSTKSP